LPFQPPESDSNQRVSISLTLNRRVAEKPEATPIPTQTPKPGEPAAAQPATPHPAFAASR
jgi:hypothetical protein